MVSVSAIKDITEKALTRQLADKQFELESGSSLRGLNCQVGSGDKVDALSDPGRIAALQCRYEAIALERRQRYVSEYIIACTVGKQLFSESQPVIVASDQTD